MKALPKTCTTEMYVYACKKFDDGYMAVATSCNMDGMSGYLLLDTKEVTLEVPQDNNLVAMEIADLESTKDSLLTEAHEKAHKIDEQIKNLQCLEHMPGES